MAPFFRFLPSRIGPVSIVGGLLIASALTRVAAGAAENLEKLDGTTASRNTQVTEQAARDQACADDADLQRVLDALRQREADLATAEAALDLQQSKADAETRQAEERIAAAEAAEAALKETMALSDAASETDLAQLTQVYERMKPKKAAALFEAMQPAFAAGFLGRMRPESAAAILAAMPPDTAYSISVIVAGRNALAGRETPESPAHETE